MVCRGLMLKLHREGLIQLPPVRKIPRNPLVERNRPTVVAVDAQPLAAKLSDIQPLQFRQVRRTPEEALFNSLLEQYHYHGYRQPVGEHLKNLSVNRHGLPPADQGRGQGKQGDVAGLRFFEADQQFAIAIEPGMGSFPTQRRAFQPGWLRSASASSLRCLI